MMFTSCSFDSVRDPDCFERAPDRNEVIHVQGIALRADQARNADRNELAEFVEHRTARISRIHRSIRLIERQAFPFAHSGKDAFRNAVAELQAERGATT